MSGLWFVVVEIEFSGVCECMKLEEVWFWDVCGRGVFIVNMGYVDEIEDVVCVGVCYVFRFNVENFIIENIVEVRVEVMGFFIMCFKDVVLGEFFGWIFVSWVGVIIFDLNSVWGVVIYFLKYYILVVI